MSKSEVAYQIIECRVASSLSQRTLAKRIGVKRSTLHSVEIGKLRPSLKLLKKIAIGVGRELHIEFRDIGSAPPQ